MKNARSSTHFAVSGSRSLSEMHKNTPAENESAQPVINRWSNGKLPAPTP